MPQDTNADALCIICMQGGAGLRQLLQSNVMKNGQALAVDATPPGRRRPTPTCWRGGNADGCAGQGVRV